MDLSLQKLKKDLKEMQQERDKAVHELSRLKQHLLEKVSCLNLVGLILHTRVWPFINL